MSESDPIEALERELRDLGPLMRVQQEAEAEGPDAAFVRTLRSRLTGEAQPMVTAAPRRSVPVQEPVSTRRRRGLRPVFGAGLVAAAIAAALIALVINSRSAQSPGTQRPVAIAVPKPNPTDLTRTFPMYGLGGGGGLPRPWDTDLNFTGGGASPYTGHLALSAGALPHGPQQLAAYRLAGGAFDAGRIKAIARALGIDSPVKYTTQPTGRWAYAETITHGGQPGVHSVAINTVTGELIYHDIRPRPGGGPAMPHNDPRNVRVARSWLAGLGWPAAKMPTHTSTATQEAQMEFGVTLGWALAAATDAPEAVFFFGPDRQIVSANVWPPIDRIVYPPVRGYANAWPQVQAGKVPIGLLGPPVYPPKSGTGRLMQRDVIDVFTAGSHTTHWLVPAYRFRGMARIKGVAQPQHWAALVPAATS